MKTKTWKPFKKPSARESSVLRDHTPSGPSTCTEETWAFHFEDTAQGTVLRWIDEQGQYWRKLFSGLSPEDAEQQAVDFALSIT